VLTEEYRKMQPDLNIVQERMRRKFAWRRKEIVEGVREGV